MKLEQWKRWMLTRGYSLPTIESYAQGVKKYIEFLEEDPSEEIDYEYGDIILTNHAKIRLDERLSITEGVFKQLLATANQEAEYQDYEPEKDQHLFKVNIAGFNLKFIGAIDQNRDLIIITIL